MSFAFAETLEAAEAHLVRALGLSPLPLPADLRTLSGEHKGEPVICAARAYASPRISYARFVTLRGAGLDIGNLLSLAAPDHPAPMFGADLVGLGKDTGVVIADLSPVPGGPALEGSPASIGAPSGALPTWCAPWFSPFALHARIVPEQTADARGALLAWSDAYVRFVQGALHKPEGASAVAEHHARYAAAHLADDRGLQLMTRIFPAELGTRFLAEVMFPSKVHA